MSSFSEVLGWHDFVAPEVVGNLDGSLMMTVGIRGRDLELASEDDRLNVSRQVERACAMLGPGWTWHLDTQNLEQPGYQDPIVDAPEVSVLVDAERRRDCLAAGAQFVMQHWLTFTRAPEMSSLDALFTKGTAASVDEQRRDDFVRRVERVLMALGKQVKITRLDRDECATYLKSTISLRRQKVNAAAHVPLAYTLPDQRFVRGRGPLCRLGDQHLAVMTLSGMPVTKPQLLAALSDLPFEFRYVTRWSGISKLEAKELMKKREEKALGSTSFFKDIMIRKYDNWANRGRAVATTPPRQRVDREELKAADQAAEAQETLSERGWGYQITIFLVWDRNAKRCVQKRSELEAALLGLGLVVRNEVIDGLTPWLMSLPGNRKLWQSGVSGARPVRRAFPINTRNLADFMPTTASHTGRGYDRQLLKTTGVKRSWLYTAGKPHYCLDSDDDGGAAHTILFGRTGKAAKSTLANQLGLSFVWPNAQIISISVGRSELGPCLMSGGTVYSFGARGSASLQPLAFVDQPAEAIQAVEWLHDCVEAMGESVTTARRQAIEDVVKALATRPVKGRTLTRAVDYLASRRPELSDVLRTYTHQGIYGHIFDGNDASSLTWSRWTMFDISTLWNMRQEAAGPALANIIYRIFQQFDGRPTLLVADEVPDWGGAPGVERALIRVLDTQRKNNVRALLIAQSPGQFVNKLPDLYASIKTSAVSTIFGPEPSALAQAAEYAQVGATPEEVTRIARLERGSYLHKLGDNTREFASNPGPIALAVTGSSSPDDLRTFEDLAARGLSGGQILREWLRQKNLLKEAEKLGLCRQDETLAQAAE